MKKVKLQAHRGVSTECPENTMSAFRCAAMQGYDVIELDPKYTSDGKIVILHDMTLNRTARNKGGSALEKETKITELTYDEALLYDYGIAFSPKFRGEKIPLLSEVLDFAKENKIRLKIDNVIQSFPSEIFEELFSELRGFEEFISLTSYSVDFIKKCLSELPNISVDYDGRVTEEVLKELSALVPREKLTVWLPYECDGTSWVKIPFADAENTTLVKKYASLGIWIIGSVSDFDKVSEEFAPDIVETTGGIKPTANTGRIYDMHTHSRNSHDSECAVADMKKAAEKCGLSGFAVTDHLDVEYCMESDIEKVVIGAIAAAEAANDGCLEVLRGVEVGEGFWHPDFTAKILEKYDFDVVVGSVHAVKYKGYEMPYSHINFAEMGRDTAIRYLDSYFDDMIYMAENSDFDVLAHITCPFRYVNLKFGLGIDAHLYKDKIEKILRTVIRRGIAFEVNTSRDYDTDYAEFEKELWITEMYRDLGGYLVTIGSDAHKAEKSASGFDIICPRLKKLGFKNIYYYKNRCALQCAMI